jgi:4-hydroxy-3-polyprenylbenzoate decarboxylase
MPFIDFQDFLAYLEKHGQLRRVTVPANPELEMAAVASRASKLVEGGPALLFENTGLEGRSVALNTFNSFKRVAAGLGLASFEQLDMRIAELLKSEQPASLGEKLLKLGESSSFTRYSPRTIKNALCQQVTIENSPSFNYLPLLKWYPRDSERLLNCAMLLFRDPATGRSRLSRSQLLVLNEREAALLSPFPLPEKLPEKLEVAVIIGEDPVLLLAACAAIPVEADGLTLAGQLRKARFEVVKARTNSLEVPACGEIVLEGQLDTKSTQTAGLVAHPNGYYVPTGNCPVFRLTAITHRQNPVLVDVATGETPQELAYIFKVRERFLLPSLKNLAPEICDINLTPAQVINGTLFVSVHKQYPGQAQKVMHAIWALPQLKDTKLIVIVDADCDVQNPAEVFRRIGATLDLSRDVNVFNGSLTPFDIPPHFGAKAGLDATRKLPEEASAPLRHIPAIFTPQIRKQVEEKWSGYGID